MRTHFIYIKINNISLKKCFRSFVSDAKNEIFMLNLFQMVTHFHITTVHNKQKYKENKKDTRNMHSNVTERKIPIKQSRKKKVTKFKGVEKQLFRKL